MKEPSNPYQMRDEIMRGLGVTHAMLLSPRRPEAVTASRVTIAMAARHLCGMSLKESANIACWGSHWSVVDWQDRFLAGEFDKYPICKLYRTMIEVDQITRGIAS